jgi:CheY-like chemotaxis protein
MPFKILYVEDDIESISLLQDTLNSADYHIIVAADITSGFEIALEQLPDLILMDINLRDISGVDIIVDLKQSPSLHHIPVIVITADSSAETLKKCFDAGCASVLHKPFSQVALLDAIRRSAKGDMPQPTEGQNIPGAPSTTLKKVLIVEDNPDLRFIFARTFDRRHFSVHVAVDGVEAIESLQAELPDILILDVNMPRLSGFDVLRYVRSNPRTRNIKVVMVTGNAMAMQSPEAEEADLLLIKPINIADLITLAQRLLPKEVL